MTELRKCPFCGGEADVDTCYSNNGFFATKTYKVFCQDCLCQTDEEYIKDKAIEAWNKRVPQTWTSKAFERIGEVNKTIEVAE